MYITEEEIPIYCPIVKETNIGHVETACFLIDAYKGTSFELKEYTELVNFNKRSRFVDFLEPYRGKLKHLPRKEVKEVYTIVPTVFSKFTRIDYSVDSLCFDEDISKYFSFYLPQGFVSPIRKLKTLKVTYTAGYNENEYPEQLKRAVGLLAQNLAQMGGTLEWTSRDDYDVKIMLKNEGIFTNEIKRLVDTITLE